MKKLKQLQEIVQFDCITCKRRFKSNYALKRHNAVVADCNKKHICIKCKKEFPNKSTLKRHEQRKTPCIIIIEGNPIEPIKKNQCRFCYKTVSTKYSLKSHLIICKVKNTKEGMEILNKTVKEKENEKIDRLLKHQADLFNEQIKKQNDKIDKLSEQLKNNIQHTNNIQVVNLIINNYKTPNIVDIITPQKLLKMFQDYGSNITGKIITDIYFNPKYPENHSIYLTNQNTNEVLVFEESTWKTSTCKKTIPPITKNIYNYITTTKLPNFQTLPQLQRSLINDIKNRRFFIEYNADDYNIIRSALILGRAKIEKPNVLIDDV